MAARTFGSVPDLLLHRVAQTPDLPAYQYPVDNSWLTITWAQALARVRAIANGLMSLGVAKGDGCAILSATRLDWVLADFGILCTGAVTTTIYPSSTPEECKFILTDSTSTVVFAEDDQQVQKLVALRGQLPTVKKVITFDGHGTADGWVITLRALEDAGHVFARSNPQVFTTAVRAISAQDLASLLYTSGTTGIPKGVELTHDCWLYEAEAINALNLLDVSDRQYLWLPLSHSFGRVMAMIPLMTGFLTIVDGRLSALVDNLAVIKPTFMAVVPRILEKIHQRILADVRAQGTLTRYTFAAAMVVGRKVSRLKQQAQKPRWWLRTAHFLAHRFVFAKIQQRFGGCLRLVISGSAPLAVEVTEFLHAAGLLILEGYGLTESSAASSVNVPEQYKFGTVGAALPGTQFKIDAVDGEIMIKGRGVMRGYHHQPDLTAEVLSADGWLRTGDIGRLDERGYLTVTDRKKDLIKTAGGKYVAPQLLEGKLKVLLPYISQVFVHGDRRPYCTALISLDADNIGRWAREHGFKGTPADQLASNSAVHAMVQHAVSTLNASLPSFETIKNFTVLPNDFTIESGELTATQKIRRKTVAAKYKTLLDSLYEPAT